MDGRLRVLLCFIFCLGSSFVIFLLPDFSSALVGWFAGAFGAIIGIRFIS